MRIFPFENSSFFIDLGENSIDISEYLDENSRLLKSIIALSKYYDYTFQLSCNQATANSFDEATLFSFHLKHSTEAVNKLKTFSQDFESFGRRVSGIHELAMGRENEKNQEITYPRGRSP